jgi:hypothetical protein
MTERMRDELNVTKRLTKKVSGIYQKNLTNTKDPSIEAADQTAIERHEGSIQENSLTASAAVRSLSTSNQTDSHAGKDQRQRCLPIFL